jgi:peroxiredoxin (alkyl hydroperoxide reductase subunit C)
MVLVGKKAPLFEASAVLNGIEIVDDFKLSDYIGKKYILLFFYPKDFTFVCPTELFAFQAKLDEFEKRNVQVIACSTDTEQSHWGWLQMKKAEGGIEGITYPVVADTNKTIANNYDVLEGEWDYNDKGELVSQGTMVAYRGTFLIDLEGIVRHQLINDEPIGRNVEEALRTIDAWQFYMENGNVCPANWKPGEESIEASHESIANYLAKR